MHDHQRSRWKRFIVLLRVVWSGASADTSGLYRGRTFPVGGLPRSTASCLGDKAGPSWSSAGRASLSVEESCGGRTVVGYVRGPWNMQDTDRRQERGENREPTESGSGLYTLSHNQSAAEERVAGGGGSRLPSGDCRGSDIDACASGDADDTEAICRCYCGGTGDEFPWGKVVYAKTFSYDRIGRYMVDDVRNIAVVWDNILVPGQGCVCA